MKFYLAQKLMGQLKYVSNIESLATLSQYLESNCMNSIVVYVDYKFGKRAGNEKGGRWKWKEGEGEREKERVRQREIEMKRNRIESEVKRSATNLYILFVIDIIQMHTYGVQT